MTKDKQLRAIKLADVMEKRRLGQALNIKEFAVLAGVSYSIAREWFQMKGFPRLEGVMFWQDFVEWRNNRYGGETLSKTASNHLASTKAFERSGHRIQACHRVPLKSFSNPRNRVSLFLQVH